MFAAAVGASKGLIPNRDFFAQYGPLTPEIQGIWLKIFGETLLNLRILSCLVAAITALVLYYLLRHRIGQFPATVIPIIWAMTGPYGLPWASGFSNLFMIAAFLSLVKVFDRDSHGLKPFLLLCAPSVFLIIGSLARIQLLITWFALLVALAFNKSDIGRWRKVLTYLFSGLITVSLVFAAFVRLRMLNSYLEQSITWPISFYGPPKLTFSYLANLAWYPLIALSAATVIYFVVKFTVAPGRVLVKVVFSAALLSVIPLTLALSKFQTASYSTMLDPRLFLITFSRRVYYSLGYLTVVCFLLVLIFTIVKYFRNRKLVASRDWLILSFGLTALTQLYPLYDPWHLWFITPIIIAAAIFLLPKFQTTAELRKGAIICSAIAIIALGLNNTSNFISTPYKFDDGILAGMRTSDPYNKDLTATLTMLRLKGVPRQIRFECPNGLYAAAGGEFLSIDGAFVNWGPIPSETAKPARQLFICEISSQAISSYASQGWILVAKERFRTLGNMASLPKYNVLFER
jgi:hypothetical protein